MKGLLFIGAIGVFLLAACNGNAPSSTTDNSGAITLSPAEKGAKQALSDIEKGEPCIQYYGQPRSTDRPLIDDETGLAFKVVAGCCVTPEQEEEFKSYNTTVRKWLEDDIIFSEKGRKLEWGEPVNGLQAGLTLRSVVRKNVLGIGLHLRLRNAGDKPIRILRLESRKDSWPAFPLEVKAKREELRYIGAIKTPPKPPDISAYIYLKPGETNSVAVVVLPKNWGLETPFEAEFTFVFQVMTDKDDCVGPYDHETKSWTTVNGLWTGEARSNIVTVKLAEKK